MTLAAALQEARAIDARAQGALLPSTEDVLRAFELTTLFCEAVDAEPTEPRKWMMARYLVAKLSDGAPD